MDYQKILDKVSEYNIDKDDIQDLVNEAKELDLSDDDNLRELILKGAQIAGKKVSETDCDHIIKIIRERGIGPDLFNLL